MVSNFNPQNRDSISIYNELDAVSQKLSTLREDLDERRFKQTKNLNKRLKHTQDIIYSAHHDAYQVYIHDIDMFARVVSELTVTVNDLQNKLINHIPDLKRE